MTLPAKSQKNDPQKKPLPKLTGKQRLWLKNYLDETNPETFFNGTRSAEIAYNTNKNGSLKRIGHENATKLNGHISKWLDEYALSDNKLKGKLFSLINAREVKLFTNRDKEGNFEIIEHPVPAIETQRKTLDMALKVKGLYKNTDSGGLQPVFNVNLFPGSQRSEPPVIDVTPETEKEDDFSDI